MAEKLTTKFIGMVTGPNHRYGTFQSEWYPTDAVDKLEKEYKAEIERLNGEMDAIDSFLARRPALNDFITSLAKVQHAIAVAAKADVAEAEIERLKKARTDCDTCYWKHEGIAIQVAEAKLIRMKDSTSREPKSHAAAKAAWQKSCKDMEDAMREIAMAVLDAMRKAYEG